MLSKPYTGLLLLILIVALPLFGHLDESPIHIWDEARLATNALEMSHNNNWIVTMVDGRPDMWNTKPPFMIWCQVLMIRMIGANELAIRLPSAIAALITCLLIFFITKKYKEPLLGLISVTVLITVRGFVYNHGTRTGDYDSLLTMFMFGYSLFYFLYIEEGKRKYLHLSIALLILAALTKGIESLIFLPPMFVYTIYKKKLISTLKTPGLYVGIAAFIFFVIGYYLLREHYNPGYIKAVRENEIGGRFNSVIESHAGDEWTLYDILINDHFHDWYLLLLPGIFAGVVSKEKWIRELTVYSTVLSCLYLIAVSLAKTKLDWYIMPIFPYLSIIVGIFIYSIFKILADIQSWKHFMSYNLLPLVFLFLIFIIPYRTILDVSLSTREDADRHDDPWVMEQYLKDVLHHQRNIDGFAILESERFWTDLYWYYKIFVYEHRPIKLIKEKEIEPNGKIIVYTPDSRRYIEDKYNTQKLDTFYNVRAYKLNGVKTDTGALK